MPRDAEVIALKRDQAVTFGPGDVVRDANRLETGTVIGRCPVDGDLGWYTIRFSPTWSARQHVRHMQLIRRAPPPLHVVSGMAPMRLEPPHARPVWFRRRPDYLTAALVAVVLASCVWGVMV